jgi:hypothetical protein
VPFGAPFRALTPPSGRVIVPRGGSGRTDLCQSAPVITEGAAMVEIPQDADVNQLSKADANHSDDVDVQMTAENQVPVVGSEGQATA